MPKQRTKYRKKCPHVFMMSNTISVSKGTSFVTVKSKTPTALKKKLSLATPEPAVPLQASEPMDVADRQLQGMRLLDLAKVSSAIASNLSCSACKTVADGRRELRWPLWPGYRSLHFMCQL